MHNLVNRTASLTQSKVPSNSASTSPITAPPMPDVSQLRAQVAERLDSLDAHVLPALERERAFLKRTWCGEDVEGGEEVVLPSGEALLVHPAGVDRLSLVLAEQEAFRYERLALAELQSALDRYEAGGSALERELGIAPRRRRERGAGATSGARARPGERETVGDDRVAYTRWMLGYLLALNAGLRVARVRGEMGRTAQLEFEFQALDARLRAWAASHRRAASTSQELPPSAAHYARTA